MDELENKLGSILGNPEMMEKIMAFAQTLGGQESKPEPDSPREESGSFPNIDPSVLQKLSGFASKSGIDQNQVMLLRALHPYVSGTRISKLERAMRAAKIAGMAGVFLGNSPLSR